MSARVRCPRCQRPATRCYCAQLPSHALQNHWPVTILQHPQESRHALGTARIAQLGLSACNLLDATTDTIAEDLAGQRVALIYPGVDSQPLAILHDQPPQRLLFIDATWRKSRRLLLESPFLSALPRYHLEALPPSRYRIRKEPRSDALSTLEAVVYALGCVERRPDRYLPLLRVMDWLIDEQIEGMGADTFTKNYFARNRFARNNLPIDDRFDPTRHE